MSQKRKGKALLEKVAKLAKASEESEKFDREQSQYFQTTLISRRVFFSSCVALISCPWFAASIVLF